MKKMRGRSLATEQGSEHNFFGMDLFWLKVPQWESKNGLLHGFLGRRGGKSEGNYASLNLSFRVGDDPQIVKDNLCDVKRAVGVHDLRVVTMKQVHGDRIVEVKDKHLKEVGPADGMVTQERELFLGVVTADCVPILYIAPERKIAAAVHAGWRGTLAGIGGKMVRHICDRYGVDPAALQVALGPSIGPCCYEIGADVSAPLIEKWDAMAADALRSRDGKTFLNLRKLNRSQLEEAGVSSKQIHEIGPCTSCAPDEFFSYRRQRGKTGHQMSFIGWR